MDMSALASPESLQVQSSELTSPATAFLVDLVSNRKIPITTPRCKVGRDDLNDIVISGDQSISRFHFVITKDNGQYYVQDGKSRHGTFLNGNQISGPEPIHDGDVLKVGVSLFWFVIEAQVAGAADKPSPVDVSTSQQQSELEFVAHEAKPAPAPMAAAAASARNAEETIAPQAPEWEAGVDSSERLTREAPAATPNETSTSLPQQYPKGTPERPASKKAESAKTVDELPIPTGLDLGAAEPNAADEANIEEAGQSPEETTAAVQEEPTKVDHDQPPQQSADHEQHSEESSEAPSEAPSDAPPDANLGHMEYQFGIAEDSIAKAADRISEQFADAHSDHAGEQTFSAEPAEPKAQETLEKFAEIVGEAKGNEEKKAEHSSLSQYLNFSSGENDTEDQKREPEAEKPSAPSNNQHEDEQTSNGAKSVMSIVKESASANVPDWCKKYFSVEIGHLDKEMNELNEQVRHLQNKIKDVEGRISTTKGLRNILLTAQGDDLVEACSKVLGLIGWRVRHSDEDKHELRLETDEKNVCIARIVWTEKEPDRSHLGQLSIAQTRYWCEQGVEPKGILVISRGNENANSGEFAGELAEYASKKNVCLMSTLQLLAVYKEVALHDGSPETVRNTIQAASGWLHGFSLDASEREESGSTNKLSSLLSA